ncbi:uncharacterized protein LOC133036225 [Cannabis sativa]|uniref:uncharacterized protein LOC133036225 n=1 Tax=Cannabis sativa TaxID=3483 RepID=UPI0029CA33DF|nr:uncharacterized protein LOC133036225 [Cannabis sativa]
MGVQEGTVQIDSGEERKGMWVNLLTVTLPAKPWLIIGDFNAPFDLEDRKGVMIWETISDHCACVISMAIDEKIVGKPFRYYNFWADHPEFKQAVLESWQKPVRAVGMKALSHKLLRLKHVMKKLNREVIRDIGRRYYEAKALFLTARMQAQAHAQDLNFQQDEKEAATNFINHEKLYHSFLRQRRKVTWLSKGVENNAYFHASLKKRRMENSIISFTNEQGVVIDNFYEVVDHYIGHFQLYMGTESRLTASLKAGPDGYGAGFFKKMWPELGADFTHAMESFFTKGSMPQEFHATMLTLIPKTENPTKVLPLIVNQNQGAFVQGRSIAHNVMILQDILKNYKRKNVSPRCTLKVDISKAYDTVSWEFLEALLNTYKMPSRFIKWIMSCLRATTYSIMMNGRVQGSFKGNKGLRQGDPFSPLLFVLIMEYLTRRLIMAVDQSKFKYHPMCKSLKIISLCFADDLMLFSKGSLSSLQVIKSVLNEFEAASGLAINANKSQLYFGGVKAEEKQAMLREMNMLEGFYPLKYLGVPLRPTKWKAEDCGVIIKKIKQRLHTWATRHLSFAGRALLIHSVLLGLRYYWMSIFILPHSITKEIEKLCESWELGHQIDEDLLQLMHEDHPRLRASPSSSEGHSPDLVPSHRMMAYTKKTMRLADATDPQVAQLATLPSAEQDSAVPMEEDREGDAEVQEVEEMDDARPGSSSKAKGEE